MAKYRITRYAIDDSGVRTETVEAYDIRISDGRTFSFYKGYDDLPFLILVASDVIEIRRVEDDDA